MDNASATSWGSLLDGLSDLLWPVLAIMIVLLLYPSIRQVIQNRAFTIKVGNMEVSASEANEEIRRHITDLQEQVSRLIGQMEVDQVKQEKGAVNPDLAKSAVEKKAKGDFKESGDKKRDEAADAYELEAAQADEPISEEGYAGTRLLWVDDRPRNNAYEIARLEDSNVEVLQATNSKDAITLFEREGSTLSAIVTDMGRREFGIYNGKAGLHLIREIRESNKTIPIFVYASKRYVDKPLSQKNVQSAGGNGLTASPIALFSMLQSHAQLDL